MGEVRGLIQMAARQHGVVSRTQAMEAGATRSQIVHRLQTGEWRALCSGVYVMAAAPATWEQRLTAAVLSHPGCIVGGRSAAVLLGFDSFKKSRPEILMPFPGNARSPLARVIRSRHFEAISTTATKGFVCTTVAETILTLSLRETLGTIERCLDFELARGKVAVSDFSPIFERLANARQRGLPMLRSLVRERADDAYQPPTTELERMLYRFLDEPILPQSIRQLPMNYPQVAATVDSYIPDWRLIVEGDGRRWHTRKADFERDRRRDNAAAAAGLVVIRFTYQMLKYQRDLCLQTLLEAGKWRPSA
jgi:very-short-patch-repair endonuclease